MTNQERLTAKDAAKLTERHDPQKAVDEILQRVKVSATAGMNFVIIRNYGFGDSTMYTSSDKYPEINKQIISELKSLGYHAEMKCEQNQFVDLYLKVSW